MTRGTDLLPPRHFERIRLESPDQRRNIRTAHRVSHSAHDDTILSISIALRGAHKWNAHESGSITVDAARR
jgi:hypothetical protein